MAARREAFEFLVVTACRSGEVRGAVWEEMDLAGRVCRIPPKRMKPGPRASRSVVRGRAVSAGGGAAARGRLRAGVSRRPGTALCQR